MIVLEGFDKLDNVRVVQLGKNPCLLVYQLEDPRVDVFLKHDLHGKLHARIFNRCENVNAAENSRADIFVSWLVGAKEGSLRIGQVFHRHYLVAKRV